MSSDPMRSPRALVRTVSLAIVASGLAGPVIAQEHGDVVRYDVRAIETTFAPATLGVDLRLPLVTAFLDRMVPEHDVPVALEDPRRLTGDDWPTFLHECLSSEVIEGFFDAEYRAGFVEVEGPPEIHARVRRILADLERHFLRKVQLEAVILDPAGVPPGTPAVLSSEEVRRLLANTEPLGYSSVTAPLGQRARLSNGSVEAQLFDFDVEVATGQSVSDPQVTVIRLGLEVGAVVHAALGGGFFVRTWSRHASQTGAPRTVEVDELRRGTVHLPSVASTLTLGSAWIEEGGGLLFGHDLQAGGLWLLRVREPNAPDSEGSPFVPLGPILAPPLLAAPPAVYGAIPSGGWYEDSLLEGDLPFSPAEEGIDPWRLIESLADDDASAGAGLHVVGSSIYVQGSEELMQRTIERVGEWSKPGQRTVSLDLRFGRLERAAATRIARGELSPTELAGMLESRLTGACRVGDCMMVVGGKEAFYVQDFDVSIAEAAAAADPILGVTFDGLTFWWRPTVASDGTIVAWTDLRWVEPLRDLDRVSVSWWQSFKADKNDSPAPVRSTGTLELPQAARAEFRGPLQLDPGAWSLVTCADLGGADHVLVVVARAVVQ